MKFLPMLSMFLLINFIAAPPASASGSQDLTLFYSNNVQGETEPCG